MSRHRASVLFVIAALTAASGCGSGQKPISVLPAPGTLTAAPGTQISVGAPAWTP
jgi:hypothetical protein